MKVQRTISIDYEIHKELKDKPGLNVSSLCNAFLKEYLEKNKNES